MEWALKLAKHVGLSAAGKILMKAENEDDS
jgi:hypothetical protein